MKKIVAFAIPTLLIITACIWYSVADRHITVMTTGAAAWVIPFANVEELANDPQVDLIIKATIVGDTQPWTLSTDERMGIDLRRMPC